jgi:GT2 family glycosyltransferase
MDEPSVAIVIVNWNNAGDTEECIRSLNRIQYSHFSIIVVDNASTGNDTDRLSVAFGESVTLIRADRNLGFSGGNNVGIAYALEQGAEFVLLLNNDTVVEPDFLGSLLDACTRDERCGMAVPKICYFASPSVIWSAGGRLSKIRASGFSRGEGREASAFSTDSKVTFASGCCMLIKAAVLREVGPWDESYFLYVEDTDYCYRLMKHGYSIQYVGSSTIYHKVNRTTKSVHQLLPMYYTMRNRLTLKDHFDWVFYLLASIYLWAVIGVKYTWWFLHGQHDHMNVVLQAVLDLSLIHISEPTRPY